MKSLAISRQCLSFLNLDVRNKRIILSFKPFQYNAIPSLDEIKTTFLPESFASHQIDTAKMK